MGDVQQRGKKRRDRYIAIRNPKIQQGSGPGNISDIPTSHEKTQPENFVGKTVQQRRTMATVDSSGPDTIAVNGVVDDATNGLRKRKKAWLDSLSCEELIAIVLQFDELLDEVRSAKIWPSDVRNAVEDRLTVVGNEMIDPVLLERTTNDVQPTVHPPLTVVEEQPLSTLPPGAPEEPPTRTSPPPSVAELRPSNIGQQPPIVPPYPQMPYYSGGAFNHFTIPVLPTVDGQSAHLQHQQYGHYPYANYYPAYNYAGYGTPPPPVPGPSQAPNLPSPFTSAPLVRNGSGKSSHKKHASPFKPFPNGEEEEDMPSYEEMIVIALNQLNEPEGTAPKDLFAWMQGHYPVQANFRPSASQALQKAFRRGRLEKSNSGKYRLNASWEGGNTSKRTTRRPQAVVPSSAASQASPPPPGQFPPYQWSNYPYPPPDPKSSQTEPGQPQPQVSESGSHSTVVESSSGAAGAAEAPPEAGGLNQQPVVEAWEAAQTILQALNFGSLLSQKPGNIDNSGQQQTGGEEATYLSDRIESFASAPTNQNPIPGPIIASDISIIHTSSDRAAQAQSSPFSSPVMSTLSAPNMQPPALPHILNLPGHRTGLQKSLAILAAQLADIAGGGSGVGIASGMVWGLEQDHHASESSNAGVVDPS